MSEPADDVIRFQVEFESPPPLSVDVLPSVATVCALESFEHCTEVKLKLCMDKELAKLFPTGKQLVIAIITVNPEYLKAER